jgi:hypothetical protein
LLGGDGERERLHLDRIERDFTWRGWRERGERETSLRGDGERLHMEVMERETSLGDVGERLHLEVMERNFTWR